MSYELVNAVLRGAIPSINPLARLVLATLASYADRDTLACFPSITTLAANTGLARRTVFNSLDELEAAGCIARLVTPGRPTQYTIILTSAPSAPVHTVHQCKPGRELVHAVHPTSAPGAPDPIIEPIREPKTQDSTPIASQSAPRDEGRSQREPKNGKVQHRIDSRLSSGAQRAALAGRALAIGAAPPGRRENLEAAEARIVALERAPPTPEMRARVDELRDKFTGWNPAKRRA